MIQRASVYIERSGRKVVIATVLQNEDGISYEDEHPVVLEAPFAPEVLGATARRAMRETRVSKRSLRDAKLSEWPAFKASKARSVREFAQRYIRIRVSGASDANVTAIVEGEPEKDAVLRVTTAVNPALTTDLGEKILLVFAACRDRKL
jgi:hypothetical protein